MKTVPLEGTYPWRPSTKQKPEPKVELLYLTLTVPLVRIRMPEGWQLPWGLSGKGLAARSCPTIPARSRTAREAPVPSIGQLLCVRLNIEPVAGWWEVKRLAQELMAVGCWNEVLSREEESPGERVTANKASISLRALMDSSRSVVFPQGQGAGCNWTGHIIAVHVLITEHVCVRLLEIK